MVDSKTVTSSWSRTEHRAISGTYFYRPDTLAVTQPMMSKQWIKPKNWLPAGKNQSLACYIAHSPLNSLWKGCWWHYIGCSRPVFHSGYFFEHSLFCKVVELCHLCQCWLVLMAVTVNRMERILNSWQYPLPPASRYTLRFSAWFRLFAG